METKRILDKAKLLHSSLSECLAKEYDPIKYNKEQARIAVEGHNALENIYKSVLTLSTEDEYYDEIINETKQITAILVTRGFGFEISEEQVLETIKKRITECS